MSRLGFEPGQTVPRERVIAACQQRIDEGHIIRVEAKEGLLKITGAAPEFVVWDSQTPNGWGAWSTLALPGTERSCGGGSAANVASE